LFAGILLMLKIGHAIGVRRLARDPEGALEGLGPAEGVIFGLLGLLIAFAFSGAASRFDNRRELIVQEANAIGTAYLRLDLLPATAQPALREDFRQYLDSRLATYQVLPDIAAAKAHLAQSNALQARIWSRALAGCKTAETNGNAVTSLVAASLNEMIDITTTRTAAFLTHPPAAVLFMLTAMVLAGALIAGHGMAKTRRSLIHILVFAVLLPISIYVILDLEYPRAGLIRVDAFDQILRDVRASMK
jgi:hypothetical protein